MKFSLVLFLGLVNFSTARAQLVSVPAYPIGQPNPVGLINFTEVTPGLPGLDIYRGGIIDSNAEEIEFLKEGGIKTVIDMRSFRNDLLSKERTTVEAGGLKFINYKISAVANLFSPNENEVDLVLAAMVNPKIPHPVFIHCDKGTDRTGMVTALFRVIYQGWDVDKAYNTEMVDYNWRTFLIKFKDYLYEHSKDPNTERARIEKVMAQQNIDLNL